MDNNIKRLVRNLSSCLLPAMVTFLSCTNGSSPEDRTCAISFSMDIDAPAVKSSIDLGEDTVNDINIFAFRDGTAAEHIFTDDMTRARLLLAPGEYDLYFVANCGKMEDYGTEQELTGWRYRIGSSASLSDSPQCFTAKRHITAAEGTTASEIHVSLIRTVARCGFRFNSEAIPGLEIKTVRLCQTALDIQPFAEEGSLPENIEEYGDYASEEDIEELNNGGTVYFHALENMQGELLPDNGDPWKKVPDSIPEKAGECSYIEVTGVFGKGAPDGLYGNVMYRFFLGQDATCDFSLERNTECVVEMTATKEGLDRISWLIDTSGMKTDPLFGFGGLSAPEYAGQWGRISVPAASSDTPVKITGGKGSIIAGKHYDSQSSISMDNGYILYYVPEVSTTDVFIYASPAAISSRKSDTCTLTLESEASSREVTLTLPAFPEYSIRESGKPQELHSVTLNEDGYDAMKIDLVLTGKNGAILRPGDFRIPEKELAYALGYISSEASDGDTYGSFMNDYISGTAISSGTAASANTDTPSCSEMEGSRTIMSGIIYGVAEGSSTIVFSNNCKAIARATVSCKVNAAFPGQRYLGEITNGQLNMTGRTADDFVEQHTLNLYNGSSGTENATWTYTRISPDAGTVPSKTAYGKSKEGFSSMDIKKFTGGKLIVDLLPPERNYGIGTTPFFTCGAFCFKGSVTNPYTGRTIEGYWIQDIILDFTVTAQVDFMPGYVCFTYVPYNICFASPEYSRTWQDNLPLLVRPDNLVNDSRITGKESQNMTFITGNRLLGLVPFSASQKQTSLEKEYRVLTLVPSGYDDTNRYPFCPAKENELTGLLWEELSSGEAETGIDIAQRTVSSFIPVRENGSYMPAVKSLSINRDNHSSYKAFEGFFRITRDYGTYKPSLLDNIGRYVIEASPKALAYQTPFYSDIL